MKSLFSVNAPYVMRVHLGRKFKLFGWRERARDVSLVMYTHSPCVGLETYLALAVSCTTVSCCLYPVASIYCCSYVLIPAIMASRLHTLATLQVGTRGGPQSNGSSAVRAPSPLKPRGGPHLDRTSSPLVMGHEDGKWVTVLT